MSFCVNSYELDTHLRDQDRYDSWLEVVSNRAADLLKEEYNPWTPANLLEALGEISNSRLVELSALGANDKRNVFGDKIHELVETYWINLAEKEAERLLEAEADDY